MNTHSNRFFSDSIQLWSFLITMLFFVCCGCTLGIFYQHLPPVLPLYNKMSWGYDRLGPSWQIFLLPCLAVCFFAGNICFAFFLKEKAVLLSRMLALTNIALAFFTCVFTLKLLLIIL